MQWVAVLFKLAMVACENHRDVPEITPEKKMEYELLLRKQFHGLIFKNEIVIDPSTNIVWTRDANLFDPILEGRSTFFSKNEDNTIDSVLKKLNESNYGGINNWRIPQVMEFERLIEYVKAMNTNGTLFSDFLNQHGFTNVSKEFYWCCYVKVKNMGMINMLNGEIALKKEPSGNCSAIMGPILDSYYRKILPIRSGLPNEMLLWPVADLKR